MGLMRRVESRVETAVGAGSKGVPPQGSGRTRSGKGSKLFVKPAELARKLVKEMEDHKVSTSTRVSVCNHYTVYLCPADHERLGDREHEILSALERHLSKHARAKKYESQGDISVSMVMDPDLSPGYFGILAERVAASGVVESGPVGSATRVASVKAVAPGRAAPALRGRAAAVSAKSAGGLTQVIGPGEAAQFGLVRQTIVLTSGDRVREFSHGRIVVGRARDVDFRVDDANVSRRHAAIYWADGCVKLEDLDSTNGTLVNGYPVTETILHSGDELVVGDCRITVETR
jgi:hypothetical protein